MAEELDDYRKRQMGMFKRMQEEKAKTAPVVPAVEATASTTQSTSNAPVSASSGGSPVETGNSVTKTHNNEDSFPSTYPTLSAPNGNRGFIPEDEDEDLAMARRLQEEYDNEVAAQALVHEDSVRPPDRQFVDRLVGGPSPYNDGDLDSDDVEYFNRYPISNHDDDDDEELRRAQELSLQAAQEEAEARAARRTALPIDLDGDVDSELANEDAELQKAIAASLGLA